MLCLYRTAPYAAIQTRSLTRQPWLLRVADAVVVTLCRHFHLPEASKGITHER